MLTGLASKSPQGFLGNFDNSFYTPTPQPDVVTDPKKIGDISEGERDKTQIETSTNAPGGTSLSIHFDPSFNPKDDGTTFHFSGVNESMKKGLKGYSSVLGNFLKGNSSYTTLLDFSSDHPKDISTFDEDSQKKLKQKMVYRFTSYNEGTKRHILIEELGEYTKKAPEGEEYKKNKAKFLKYFTATGFAPDELQTLHNTVARLSDALLGSVSGIKFKRGAVYAEKPTAGGLYSRAEHSLTIFDLAYKSDLTLLGDKTSGFNTNLEMTILHEIGHAIDSNNLRLKSNESDVIFRTYEEHFAEYKKANEEFTTKWASHKSGDQYSFENQQSLDDFNAGKASIKELGDKADATYNSYQSSNEEYKNMKSTSDSEPFRKATNTDSAVRITDYAGTSWAETFAESFSLYHTDPDRLKSLRPEVYKFFESGNYK